jgi:tetratricopeptide (TPR) repeat protein
MEITKDKPQPLALKGACLHNLSNYTEAIACLTMALEYKTGMLDNIEKGSVLETRSMCYNALGMKDKADNDSAEAERLAKVE